MVTKIITSSETLYVHVSTITIKITEEILLFQLTCIIYDATKTYLFYIQQNSIQQLQILTWKIIELHKSTVHGYYILISQSFAYKCSTCLKFYT
jgi:hypothetical protein